MSRDSRVGVPKFPKLGLPRLWRPISLCVDLLLRWGLMQSCSSHQELSNDMWHATYTQGNWDDSWLLVVGSQIDNLTTGPSFDHNLCFRYPNVLCEPILDKYVTKYFQWYKEFFNPLIFYLCNCSLKIQKSSRLQLPKWELTWECGGSFPHTLPHSHILPHSHTPENMKSDSRASLLVCTFASPCLGHEPKARIAITSPCRINWPPPCNKVNKKQPKSRDYTSIWCFMHQSLGLYTTNMVDVIWNLDWSLKCKFEHLGQFWLELFFQTSSFISSKVWAFESP